VEDAMMEDRRQQARRDESSGMTQQDADYGARGGALTQQQGSETGRWDASRGGSGDWQGYVVPYRYYGPGYQGVGYYSVLYQGPGEGDEGGQRGDQGRWNQGDQGQWQQAQRGQGQQWQQGQRWQQGQGSQGQGGYAGRGPKNYQRSDERLREEINDRLMANDQVDASEIEVQVRGGEVNLTGTVPERWMKRLAEDVVEQVMGVRDVMNQIRVQGERQREDSGASGSSRSTRSSGSSTSTVNEREQTEPNGKRRTASSSSR
jgi:osmotically-inducible protein OsmY